MSSVRRPRRHSRRSCTVGGGAGFAGDRLEPAVRLAASGEVDAVVLECLAERTLTAGLAARADDPAQGFDHRLRRRLEPLLPVAAQNSCAVVSNLGAANPRAAGEATVRLCRELGLDGTRIAVVYGDDVADRARSVEWSDPGVGTVDWLGVHAYLGCAELAAALDAGADVVLAGRVADSALFAAPVVARLGLPTSVGARPSAADSGLAGALTAGHLLECGGQISGGNLAVPGPPALSPRELAALGHPLATVDTAGEAHLKLRPDDPGRLDAMSCTLQLFYEVHDPAAYITPDAVLDFRDVRLEADDRNGVRCSGVRAGCAPEKFKVVGFRRFDETVVDAEIAYAGTGAGSRAALAADVLRLRLERAGFLAENVRVDLVGVNSVLGGASIPLRTEPVEVRAHVSARCFDTDAADVVQDEVYALTLSGPAGGCGMRTERRQRVDVVSGLIDRALVPAEVEVMVA